MRKTFILLITALLMASSAFGAITEATPRAEYTAAGGDTYQCADTGGSSQGWPIWVKTDLRVWLDGTLQVVDTDYTVTFTAGDDSDCSITFVSTPTVGLVVAMERASDQERASDFATSGPFSMKSMNSQLDYLTTLAQDNAARINRTARLDPGEEIDAAFSRLPQPEASKILGYDATGAYINYAAEEGGSWDGLADLADNSVGKGSDLVAHTGTADTMTEALAKKVDVAGDTMTGTLELDDNGESSPNIKFIADTGSTYTRIVQTASLLNFVKNYQGGGESIPLSLETNSGVLNSLGNRVLTTADEGSGNGLDADTVDGFHGSAIVGELVGDGTAGRVMRVVTLLLDDGTNANTVKATLIDVWNGDSQAVTDNIAGGDTSGIFTLDANGYTISFDPTGDAVAVLSTTITTNSTATNYFPLFGEGTNLVVGGIFGLGQATGPQVDLRTALDTSEVLKFNILYLTDQ